MQNQPPKELTEKALDTKFSFMFTRREVLVIRTLILQEKYNLADAKILIPVVDAIESTAIKSIANQDYKEVKPPTPDAPTIN